MAGESNQQGMIPAGAVGGQARDLLPQQNAATASASTAVLAMHQRAIQQGRDEMVIEERLLADFSHPGLGDIGIYCLPFGKKPVYGLSIRAAEQIQYRWGHTLIQCTLTPAGDDVLVSVQGMDFVTNNMVSQQTVVPCIVERRDADAERELVRMRTNSSGDRLYVYRATEAEMLRNCNAAQSKLKRNVIVQLLPPVTRMAIFERAMAAKMGEFDDKKNRRQVLKQLADDYREVKVSAKEIADFLGYPLADINAEDYKLLRNNLTAIKAGDITWKDALEHRKLSAAAADEPGADPEGEGDLFTLGAEKKDAK